MVQSGLLHVYLSVSGECVHVAALLQVFLFDVPPLVDSTPHDESFPVSLSLASVLP